MTLERKEITEGQYKGHVYLHDQDTNTIHHQHIPHHMLPHHMLKFYPKDILQVIIGATVLAIPLSYTQETWELGSNLPLANVLMIGILSLTFISAFVFYNYYKHRIFEHKTEFLVRALTTYVLALLVVSVILTLIGQTDWVLEPLIAMKRIIIIGFPASMSAAITDVLK